MVRKRGQVSSVKNRAWRMMIRALAISIGLAASLAGCRSHDSQADKRLLTAEAVMHSHPDSALHLLQAISHPEAFKGLNQGLYALLHTQAAFKNYLPVTSDSLITIAVDYFSQTPDSLRKAWSCFYAGQVYRDLKDFPKAIHYYHQAASAGENIEDYKFLDLLYYHWGLRINQDKPYEEGLEKLQKSKEYAEKGRNTSGVIYCLGEMAWSYLWMKDYQMSEQCLNEAVALAKKCGYEKKFKWLYYRLSLLYWNAKDYTKGLLAIDSCLHFNNDIRVKKSAYMLKGKLLIDLRQYDSARHYLFKGIDENDLYTIANHHLSMTKLYKQLGNYPKALEHHEEFSKYMDSIKHEEEDERVIDLQKKYDYTIVRAENERLKVEKYKLSSLAMFIVLFLLVILFVFYWHFTKSRREKEQVIQKQKSRIKEIQLLLQQEQIKLSDNQIKTLEYEQQLNYFAKEQEGLKEENRQQRFKLEEYKKEQELLRERLLNADEIFKYIEQVKGMDKEKLKQQGSKLKLSEAKLDALISLLDICYNHFPRRICKQYPLLSKYDLYICGLLKLGARSRDITYLLDISNDTLKKRKYRIKKDKLSDLKEAESLEEFLDKY